MLYTTFIRDIPEWVKSSFYYRRSTGTAAKWDNPKVQQRFNGNRSAFEDYKAESLEQCVMEEWPECVGESSMLVGRHFALE